jgi:hypothetical protein
MYVSLVESVIKLNLRWIYKKCLISSSAEWWHRDITFFPCACVHHQSRENQPWGGARRLVRLWLVTHDSWPRLARLTRAIFHGCLYVAHIVLMLLNLQEKRYCSIFPWKLPWDALFINDRAIMASAQQNLVKKTDWESDNKLNCFIIQSRVSYMSIDSKFDVCEWWQWRMMWGLCHTFQPETSETFSTYCKFLVK